MRCGRVDGWIGDRMKFQDAVVLNWSSRPALRLPVSTRPAFGLIDIPIAIVIRPSSRFADVLRSAHAVRPPERWYFKIQFPQAFQSDRSAHSFHPKIVIPFFRNVSYPPRIPPRQEGRLAIVTNAGRDAVAVRERETSASRCGRWSRVVLAPRSRRQVREMPTRCADDGVNKAVVPGKP